MYPFLSWGSSMSSSSVGGSNISFPRLPDGGVFVGRFSCEFERAFLGVRSTLRGGSPGGPNFKSLAVRALLCAGCDDARVVGVTSEERFGGENSGPTDRLAEPPIFVTFRGDDRGGGSLTVDLRLLLNTS